jgi:hypothetical protein
LTVTHLANLTSFGPFPAEWTPSFKNIRRRGRFNKEDKGCVTGADATANIMAELVLNSILLNACAIDSHKQGLT